MPVTLTSLEGVLRWGYHSAARLRHWTMTRNEAGQWTVTGTLAEVNDYAVSQRPLTFVTPKGLAWPITELQIAGASCVAVLGPKESRDVAMPICTT